MNRFEVGDCIRLPHWRKCSFLMIKNIRGSSYVGDFITDDLIYGDVSFEIHHPDWTLVINELDFYKDVAKL